MKKKSKSWERCSWQYAPVPLVFTRLGKLFKPSHLKVYQALWSFRNPKNKTCHPSFTDLSERAGVCLSNIYSIVKDLEKWGIIKANKDSKYFKYPNYRFSVVDCEAKDWERIKENLIEENNQRKDGKESTEEKPVESQEQTSETTGTDQSFHWKPKSQKHLSRKEEKPISEGIRNKEVKQQNKEIQQQKKDEPVVDRNILNLKNKLKKKGVKEPNLSKLLQGYDSETISKYLRWLPYYQEVLKGKVRNEAGLLVSAILNGRGAPERLKLSDAERGVRGDHTTKEWEAEEKRLKDELGDTF